MKHNSSTGTHAGSLGQLLELTGPFRFLREPGGWFFAALALGLGVRLYLLLATPGTTDMLIWDMHARGVSEQGLIPYYHVGRKFWHPPFVSSLLGSLWDFAVYWGFDFAALFRGLFGLFDIGCAVLLFFVLRDRPQRYAIAALYWINPVAILLSSYHGNTDTAVAFFLLAAALAAARRRAAWAGAFLGLGLWFKVPILLGAPALLFAIPGWRERIFCGLVAFAVGLSTYLPVLIIDPEILVRRLNYGGQILHTTAGIPVWGIWSVLPEPADGFATLYDRWNTVIFAVPVLFVSWMRRHRNEAPEIGRTIGLCYCLVYGLTTRWAFQYFAWSVPFWLLCGWPIAVATTLAASAYLYGLYAYLCGNLFLQGRWDFVGHPIWPRTLIGLRNASVIVFFASGLAAIASASREALRNGK